MVNACTIALRFSAPLLSLRIPSIPQQVRSLVLRIPLLAVELAQNGSRLKCDRVLVCYESRLKSIVAPKVNNGEVRATQP